MNTLGSAVPAPTFSLSGQHTKFADINRAALPPRLTTQNPAPTPSRLPVSPQKHDRMLRLTSVKDPTIPRFPFIQLPKLSLTPGFDNGNGSMTASPHAMQQTPTSASKRFSMAPSSQQFNLPALQQKSHERYVQPRLKIPDSKWMYSRQIGRGGSQA
jgi:hypothetical protein